MKAITLMKFKDINAFFPLSRRTLYRRINDGLWTKAVRMSDNLVAWPSNEVELLVASRIEGKSRDQIVCLVKSLEVERHYLLQGRTWVWFDKMNQAGEIE